MPMKRIAINYPNGLSVDRAFAYDTVNDKNLRTFYRTTTLFLVHGGHIDFDNVPHINDCDFFDVLNDDSLRPIDVLIDHRDPFVFEDADGRFPKDVD